MSTTNVQALERAAIDAHARGIGWSDFWEQHGVEVCAAEPQDRQRFARLVRRLLALLTSGNDNGMHAAGQLTPLLFAPNTAYCGVWATPTGPRIAGCRPTIARTRSRLTLSDLQ